MKFMPLTLKDVLNNGNKEWLLSADFYGEELLGWRNFPKRCFTALIVDKYFIFYFLQSSKTIGRNSFESVLISAHCDLFGTGTSQMKEGLMQIKDFIWLYIQA